MSEKRTLFTGASQNEIQDYKPEEDGYGDGDVPEIDTKPYKNGAWVESPSHGNSVGHVQDSSSGSSGGCVERLPESGRPRRDGPGGE